MRNLVLGFVLFGLFGSMASAQTMDEWLMYSAAAATDQGTQYEKTDAYDDFNFASSQRAAALAVRAAQALDGVPEALLASVGDSYITSGASNEAAGIADLGRGDVSSALGHGQYVEGVRHWDDGRYNVADGFFDSSIDNNNDAYNDYVLATTDFDLAWPDYNDAYYVWWNLIPPTPAQLAAKAQCTTDQGIAIAARTSANAKGDSVDPFQDAALAAQVAADAAQPNINQTIYNDGVAKYNLGNYYWASASTLYGQSAGGLGAGDQQIVLGDVDWNVGVYDLGASHYTSGSGSYDTCVNLCASSETASQSAIDRYEEAEDKFVECIN